MPFSASSVARRAERSSSCGVGQLGVAEPDRRAVRGRSALSVRIEARFIPIGRRLGLHHVVDGELLDLRRAGRRRIAERGDRGADAALEEGVELGAGLPEVEDAPAVLDRAGGVKDQPVGRIGFDPGLVR